MANPRHRVEHLLPQIAYCTRPHHSECVRMTMGLDEIKDVHFSGGLSLVEWCLGGYIDQI